jgi:hypothetical protein
MCSQGVPGSTDLADIQTKHVSPDVGPSLGSQRGLGPARRVSRLAQHDGGSWDLFADIVAPSDPNGTPLFICNSHDTWRVAVIQWEFRYLLCVAAIRLDKLRHVFIWLRVSPLHAFNACHS